MPMHDWSRIGERLFHSFRAYWLCDLCRILNQGGLPKDHYALMTKAVIDVCEQPRTDICIYRGMELIKIATIKLFTPQTYHLASIVHESKEVPDTRIERLSVGSEIPDLTLFLESGQEIIVPLELAYNTAWEQFPEPIRARIEA